MHLLFSQEEGSLKYPFSNWISGNYKFRLFLNYTDVNLYQETACSGPKKVTDYLLSGYEAGKAVLFVQAVR
jgi:hypothetical protein